LAPSYNPDAHLPIRRRNSGDIEAVQAKAAAIPNGGTALPTRFTPSRSPANFAVTAVLDKHPLPNVPTTPTLITSLGKPRPRGATPKKPALAEEEEDIFASMGLAANPRFSHAASPSSTRPVTGATVGRYAQPAFSASGVGTTTGITRAAAGAAATKLSTAARLPIATTQQPTSVLPSMNSLPKKVEAPAKLSSVVASSSFDASGGDDNADWGEDADLDDLFDD
jgi:hypothetical protein